MTVKNRQIARALPALNELYNTKLPDGAEQFPLIRFAQKFDPASDAYLKAERLINDKYLKRREDGLGWLVENGLPVLNDASQRAAFEAEIEKLQDMDADLTFKRIPWSLVKGVAIAPIVLRALDWVFEELPAE
jgi:hypothetical protein